MLALSPQRYDTIHYGLICLALSGVIAAVVLDEIWLSFLVPAVIVAGYMILYNIRLLYGSLFMMIPLSAEISLPGGLSTDLMGEPILWLLTGVTLSLIHI